MWLALVAGCSSHKLGSHKLGSHKLGSHKLRSSRPPQRSTIERQLAHSLSSGPRVDPGRMSTRRRPHATVSRSTTNVATADVADRQKRARTTAPGAAVSSGAVSSAAVSSAAVSSAAISVDDEVGEAGDVELRVSAVDVRRLREEAHEQLELWEELHHNAAMSFLDACMSDSAAPSALLRLLRYTRTIYYYMQDAESAARKLDPVFSNELASGTGPCAPWRHRRV